MSMIGMMRRVEAAELQALLADPGDAFWYIHGHEPYEPPPSLLQRIFAGRKPAVVREQPWTEPPASHLLDLGQSWHCLHFLYCGEPWESEFPAGFLLAGGEQVGDVDVGYGPARAYRPAELAQIDNFLDAISEQEMRARCDPTAMSDAQIYGAVESDEDWPYLEVYLREIRTFVKNAASAAEGMLVYLY